jgi:hypothetical protein
MNRRIIRDEIDINFKSKEIGLLSPKTSGFHPINLEWINNTDTVNPLCLTKFQMDKKNNLNIFNNYKCKNNLNDYKKNLYIPIVGLESSDLLNVYSIDSIDSLYEWINENLDKLLLPTINRILNCWIRVNYETLKNYNNYLEKIYFKIFVFIFKDKIIQDETTIKKDIKNFIDYWINKNSVDEFNLNLLNDLNQYVIKKFLNNKM